jgi:hypothetical protein
MGIDLTEKEFNELWKKMVGNKEKVDFVNFKEFHDKYCVISSPSEGNTFKAPDGNTTNSNIN